MSTAGKVGIGATILGVLVLFGSCGDDSPKPIKRTTPAWTTTTTATPTASPDGIRTNSPRNYSDDDQAGRIRTSTKRSTARTTTPRVDVPDADVPTVKRDRNGRCRDSRGRFTRCP